MDRDDGGPAFPLKEPVSSDATGMSLRDWLAGQALAGMLAHGYCPKNLDQDWHQAISEESYEMADAMLAARRALEGGPTSEAQQEPVAWRWRTIDAETWVYDPSTEWLQAHGRNPNVVVEPLFTRPAEHAVTEAKDE